MFGYIVLGFLISDFQSVVFSQPHAERFSEEILDQVNLKSFEFASIPSSNGVGEFEIQKTEVTQFQWFSMTGENPSRFSDKGYIRAEPNEPRPELDFNSDFVKVAKNITVKVNHPVERVSLPEIRKFLQKLNDADSKYTYRLPTEAEFLSARGQNLKLSDEIYENNSFTGYWDPQYAPGAVASKSPNSNGVYDLYGNLREWTSSQEQTAHPSAPGRMFNAGVVVGCHFSCSETQMNSKNRALLIDPDEWTHLTIGFRLVRTAK